MKRNLIAIAGAVLALGSNLALAQDQFMDSYWKDLSVTKYVASTSSSEASADFGFVDRTPAQ
jgi:hypothetical protein